MNRSIFLATTITSLIDAQGRFVEEERHKLEYILRTLRVETGLEVFCAIEREKWGEELMTGEVCTSLDFIGLDNADYVVALPANSYGVHVELGWASALKKPMTIILSASEGAKSPLIEGLGTMCDVNYQECSEAAPIPSMKEWDAILPSVIQHVSREFKRTAA